MEGEVGGEFQDWEVLQSSDAAPLAKNSESLIGNTDRFEEIGGESGSEGMIRSNYFSLDNQGSYVDASEDDSVESDNPSWIDPGSDNRYGMKDSGEFWSDSGSYRSEERKIMDVDVRTGLDLGKFWSDSCGDELTSEGGNGHSAEKEDVHNEEEEEEKGDGKSAMYEEKKVVRWKVPFEVLKYCVFRTNPVWFFSVAAALMGFVILGRRLYKLKRKSQSFHLNVTVDDKKVSQLMNRVARLNEAFSVVRRVPMVRPSLPAAGAGISPWPAMSMR